MYVCLYVCMFVCMYVCTVGVMEKNAITVHRSRKRRSLFSSHPASWPAGQPFSEQTASDMIGYSLPNDWNAVSGTPAIGKFLPSDRIAIRLAAPDANTISRRPLIG